MGMSSMAAKSIDPGPFLLNFELLQDCLAVLFTCKNEEDKIKTEGAGVLTTLHIDFTGSQWQLAQ